MEPLSWHLRWQFAAIPPVGGRGAFYHLTLKHANGGSCRSELLLDRGLHLLHRNIFIAVIPVRLALHLAGGTRLQVLYFATKVPKILSRRGPQMHQSLLLMPIVDRLISARFRLKFGVLNIEEGRLDAWVVVHLRSVESRHLLLKLRLKLRKVLRALVGVSLFSVVCRH